MTIFTVDLSSVVFKSVHLVKGPVGDFYRAMRKHSAEYAVASCPSVRHTPILCRIG